MLREEHRLKYLRMVVKKILDLTGNNWQKVGEYHIMWSLVSCTPHQILLELTCQGEFDGHGM
jgi:hypothetical protein